MEYSMSMQGIIGDYHHNKWSEVEYEKYLA